MAVTSGALISVYVPRARGLKRADLTQALGDVTPTDLKVTRGRQADLVEITLPAALAPEVEGELRARIAAIVGTPAGATLEQLERRVADLEAQMRDLAAKLGGAK